MNILFVTLYALETNTSVTKSNYGLIKGLQELGHKVVLLMPEMDRELSYYDNSLDLSEIEIERILNNNLGQQIANHSSKMHGIKKQMFSLARNVYGKCKIFDRTKALITEAKNFNRYDEYFDIVISTSDPKTSHLFVKELIKNGLKYGKWIQHWGDPLAGDISRDNIYPNFFIEYVERQIIQRADRVIYVSPFTLEMQKRRYDAYKEKLKFVPLPCDENDEDICSQNKKDNLKSKKNKKLVYLGDYTSTVRNIKPLYSACANMSSIELVIAGNTDLKLEEKTNIKIMNRIPQSEAKKLENEADIIVSIGNLAGSQIPGKLYYAASSNKTILVAIDGDNKTEMKKYLETFKRYVCCENTEEDLRRALVTLKNIGSVNYETPEILYPVNVAREILS